MNYSTGTSALVRRPPSAVFFLPRVPVLKATTPFLSFYPNIYVECPALVNRKCNKYDETTRNVRVLIYVKWSVGSHTDKATPRCALPVTLQFLRTQGNDSRAAAPDSPQHPTSCTSYSYIGPHGLRPYERHPRNTTANTTTHEFHQTGFCAPCATKIDRHSATCCGHVGSWKESEQGTSPLASHLCRIGSVQGITPTTRYLDCRPS